MKLVLKPNFNEFSFHQLVDFFNKYLGEEQNCSLVMDGDHCKLLRNNGRFCEDNITEEILRNYFYDEVEREDINCLDFFEEK